MTFLEASKIAMVSASEALIGLSMNIRLPALKTVRACSRCRRPSFVSSKTTSTFVSRSWNRAHDLDTELLDVPRVAGNPVHTRLEVETALRVGGHHPVAQKLGRGLSVVERLCERDGV